MKDLKVLSKFDHFVAHGFKPDFEMKLNRKELELIQMLEKHPNEPMRHYGRHLRVEKGSFSYLVDLLEAKGLLVRVADEEDKRSSQLELTEQGLEIAAKIKEARDKHLEEKLSIFDEEELKELDSALETIEKLFKKIEKEHPRPKRCKENRGGRPRGGHPRGRDFFMTL